MKTIATKIAALRPFAAGIADDALRHIIHGVGGSPRRAKRLLRSDPNSALGLGEDYVADITAGVPHVTAVRNGAMRFESLAAQAA